jgi:hypothetical protein
MYAMAPSRTRILSSEQAAYIAGLIDGEGTITLTREHRGERRRMVVSIANTEMELLSMAGVFGTNCSDGWTQRALSHRQFTRLPVRKRRENA